VERPPTDLELATPGARLVRWERGTRLWARVGAVLMAAGAVAEPLALRAVQGSGPNGWTRSLLSPSTLSLLLTAVVVWVLAGHPTLARRGFTLSAASALGILLIMSTYGGGEVPREAWPLGTWWMFMGAAVLGLLLLGTRAAPRTGRGLCLWVGLAMVVVLLAPTEGWDAWRITRLFELHRWGTWLLPYVVGMHVVAAVALIVAGSVTRTAPGPVRVAAVLLGLAWAMDLTLALMAATSGLVERVSLAAALMQLQRLGMWQAPWLVLVVGVFAWIVGAQHPRSIADEF
jgi:hypothetical protein